MAPLLGALVLAGGHHKAFALAGILTLATVLRALARTLTLAGVRPNALHAGTLRRARRRGARVLRHSRRSDE